MLRTIIGVLVSAVLLGAGMPPAEAHAGSPVLSRVVEKGVLRVGMSGNQPPLNFVGKSGSVMGLEPDLAQMLGKSMGVDVKFVTKPFGELLSALEKGEVDLVMSGMTITPGRNMRAAFVGPYYVSGKAILAKVSKLESVDQQEEIDMAEIKIAALEGSTSQKFVEALAPSATLVTTPDYDAAIAKLIADEVDVFVGDLPICVLSVLRHPEANLATTTQPLTLEPIGIAVPPDDPLLVNFLQNTLAAISGTGALEVLWAKWLKDGSWLDELP